MQTIDGFFYEMTEYLHLLIQEDRGVNLKDLTVERFFDFSRCRDSALVKFRVKNFNTLIAIVFPIRFSQLPDMIIKALVKCIDADVRDNLFLYKYGQLTMI